MIDWTPVLVALCAALPGTVAAIVSLGNRRRLTTHNGRTIGQQVEEANVSSAASLVHTTRLVEDVVPPVPPLVDAARAGLAEAAGAVPHVLTDPPPKDPSR